MLKATDLNFAYTETTRFSFPEIRCERGEHLLLIGESGKGKTTLLHLLAGMLSPTKGKVEIDGRDITHLSGSELDRFRGSKVGIVFQVPHFVESLSVLENLLLPQFLTGKKPSRQKAKDLLRRLRIEEMQNKKPGQLSSGEKQRVAIARAMMNDPVLILADEPTSALDDRNAEEVIRMLEEQASSAQASLVIVTHDKRLKDRFPKSIEI
ncbi:MAG: hypothetical protein RL220_334 [Bacteroidota bacterium]